MPNPQTRSLLGVVVSAGRCLNTVRVRTVKMVWNSHLRKSYPTPTHHLADDFRHSCVPGDVVRLAPGLRTSRWKRHVVDAIVSAMRTGEVRAAPEGVEGWERRREERKILRAARRREEEEKRAEEEAERERVGESKG